MIIKLNLGLFLLLFFLFEGLSQSVEFYKEELNFSIKENSFKVVGLYYFRNLSDDTIRKYLIYPFPNEAIYGKIDSVVIYDSQSDKKENILSGINSKGAYFIITIKPKGVAAYEISYSQQIASKKAKYILTTMNNWRNKLEKANFELSFPVSICIDSINFIPKNTFKNQNRIIWQWSNEDFMPVKDIDIYFR